MKIRELKPILEVLDENIEVEFTIVSRQEPPKNELRVRDNYRTCGHATNIEDSDGLTGLSMIPKVLLVFFVKRISDRFAIKTKQEQRGPDAGNGSLFIMVNFSKLSENSFVKSMRMEGMSSTSSLLKSLNVSLLKRDFLTTRKN